MILEVELVRDSGGRARKIRRALTSVSNQLGFGFRIPQLVGHWMTSLQQCSLPGFGSADELMGDYGLASLR